MKKVLIFGATGAIGANASLALKEHGYEVIAVSRRSSDNGFFREFGIPYHSVDITKPEDFSKIEDIKNIDTVIHLAGLLPAGMDGYHPELYFDSVLKGTFNVLNYIVKVGAKKIVFSHSRADSNYLMDKGPIPSDIVRKFPPNNDHSIYTICKNAAVDLIEHYYYRYGLNRFVLRFPTVYSYHPNKYFHVDGIKKVKAYRYLIDQAIAGNDLEIWGDPSKAKEIVYIGDALQLIEKCIESEKEGGIYNLGRGEAVTLEDQIRGIVDVFCEKDKKSRIIYRPDKPNAREFVHDISKTVDELGYHPMFDYHTMLMEMKKEMELQRFKKLWGVEKDYE